MVYGRGEALAYIDNPDPAGSSHVFTATSNDLLLNTFAHYAVKDPVTKKQEYHQYQLGSVAMTGTFQDYKRGRKQVRNLQDRGRKESLLLRDSLVEYQQYDDESPLEPLDKPLDEPLDKLNSNEESDEDEFFNTYEYQHESTNEDYNAYILPSDQLGSDMKLGFISGDNPISPPPSVCRSR